MWMNAIICKTNLTLNLQKTTHKTHTHTKEWQQKQYNYRPGWRLSQKWWIYSTQQQQFPFRMSRSRIDHVWKETNVVFVPDVFPNKMAFMSLYVWFELCLISAMERWAGWGKNVLPLEKNALSLTSLYYEIAVDMYNLFFYGAKRLENIAIDQLHFF